MLNDIFNESVVDREKVIVKTSMIGIITNIFLAGFKASIGILSNSIADSYRHRCYRYVVWLPTYNMRTRWRKIR